MTGFFGFLMTWLGGFVAGWVVFWKPQKWQSLKRAFMEGREFARSHRREN